MAGELLRRLKERLAKYESVVPPFTPETVREYTDLALKRGFGAIVNEIEPCAELFWTVAEECHKLHLFSEDYWEYLHKPWLGDG